MDTVGCGKIQALVCSDYLGWVGTCTFSNENQDAIDRRYVADKNRDIAIVLAPHVAVLQQLAAAEVCALSRARPTASCRTPSSAYRAMLPG